MFFVLHCSKLIVNKCKLAYVQLIGGKKFSFSKVAFNAFDGIVLRHADYFSSANSSVIVESFICLKY